jgi:hypothetical protein
VTSTQPERRHTVPIRSMVCRRSRRELVTPYGGEPKTVRAQQAGWAEDGFRPLAHHFRRAAAQV